MPLSTAQKRNLVGNGLVVLQFALLLVQAALAAPNVLRGTVSAVAWLLAAAAIALAVWTLRHNRLGNFNIRPLPKADAVLVTSGPYHWIRHPIYTALLLGCAALACSANPLMGWLTWSALAGVLRWKSALEEQWLREKFPHYAAYSQVTRRFVPGVY